MPEEFTPVLDSGKTEPDAPAPAEDPFLELRGLGKEMWRKLGGGEKFIRELRENWYGRGSTSESPAPPGNKAG